MQVVKSSNDSARAVIDCVPKHLMLFEHDLTQGNSCPATLSKY